MGDLRIAGLYAKRIGVVVGAGLVGLGIGSVVDNVVRYTRGLDWTASLGGLVAGFGAAVILVSLIAGDPRRRFGAGAVLVFVGAVIAGYALGGGLDDLLREIDGEAHTFLPAATVVGLGIGAVVVGWSMTRRSDRGV